MTYLTFKLFHVIIRVRRSEMEDDAWVTEAELAALGLERATGINAKDGGYEGAVDQAHRMLREAAPMAAASLVRLARHSESDTIRLRASTEILNRAAALGSSADGREPWAEVYEKTLTTGDIDKMIADANRWRSQSEGN
jgi:hypothetical protein